MQPIALKTWLAWTRILLASVVLGGVASEAGAACTAPWIVAGTTLYNNGCTKVAVGTNAPAYSFHVFSSGSPSEVTTESTVQGDTGLRLIDPGRSWKVGIHVLGAGTQKFNISDLSAGLTRFTIDTAGNAGIGTTAPNVKLDVNGNMAIANSGNSLLAGAQFRTYLSNDSGWGISNPANAGTGGNEFHVRVHGYGGGTGKLRQFQVIDSSSSNAVRLAINFDTGNVGLGTTDPSEGGTIGSKLTVRQADNNTGLAVMEKDTGARRFALNGIPGGAWTMYDGSGGTWTPGISQNAGNVGIGQPAPVAKLDVNGNVNVTGSVTASGNIAAKYQDVAEWVPATARLESGTVVVIGSGRRNEVSASRKAYDTAVAGVVSTQPGVLLGEGGDGKAMVATTGRVRVKVDAARGPVGFGDLLVTSDREGYAMRSEPIEVAGVKMHRPGTLIGKALEPLQSGQGEILVLLSLQ